MLLTESWSFLPISSLAECMASIGTPMSTVFIGSQPEIIGPSVPPPVFASKLATPHMVFAWCKAPSWHPNHRNYKLLSYSLKIWAAKACLNVQYTSPSLLNTVHRYCIGSEPADSVVFRCFIKQVAAGCVIDYCRPYSCGTWKSKIQGISQETWACSPIWNFPSTISWLTTRIIRWASIAQVLPMKMVLLKMPPYLLPPNNWSMNMANPLCQ